MSIAGQPSHKRPSVAWLSVLYIATAHIALALACTLAAYWPRSTAGFFYHPWMAAIVHLVTLGWITSSILGMLYLAAPAILGRSWSPRRGDYIAWGLVIIGIVGLVAHFLVEEFGGMAWSAATITAGVLYVVGRALTHLRGAPGSHAGRLHVALASMNLLGAAIMGTLMGFDKVYHFLPGYVLSNVFAHAHLAAVGWAGMMILGIGSGTTLVGPAARRSMLAGAILLEVGVVGLFVSLVLQSGWTCLFGPLVVAGFAVEGAGVLRERRRLAPGLPRAARCDYGMWHVVAASAALAVASGLGLLLIFAPTAYWWPRVAAAYGAFGLLGFLAQSILALEAELLPMRSGSGAVFYLWTVGVPIVGLGLFVPDAMLIRAGALLLLSAVVLAFRNVATTLAAWPLLTQGPTASAMVANDVR